jgi:hypothetical protein
MKIIFRYGFASAINNIFVINLSELYLTQLIKNEAYLKDLSQESKQEKA